LTTTTGGLRKEQILLSHYVRNYTVYLYSKGEVCYCCTFFAHTITKREEHNFALQKDFLFFVVFLAGRFENCPPYKKNCLLKILQCSIIIAFFCFQKKPKKPKKPKKIFQYKYIFVYSNIQNNKLFYSFC